MPDYTVPDAWRDLLRSELDADYMLGLSDFIAARRDSGAAVFPPREQVFNAFVHTPPEDLRVVILGQDPYHQPGQAHGLSFSVNRGVPVPPSLRNIFRELEEDLGISAPRHGCLEAWAKQGVLLLNTVLTVEEGNPGSHRGKGWELFTDAVIALLAKRSEPLVFFLWGSQAQRKAGFIDGQKHCVLKAPHPSPLSAYRGFFGCGHFGKANAFLRARGREPINWSIDS
ncbi:uracil-DNA glycosylase [Congregibacter litoralis]|uniref:Uracil-DNA glycosylase n=1 Tax=Congregibacter litoralis KT71 TaxID=314285 RepID=A4A3V8_9GAMM|nr:uracil-DNA glycosylase [Congregibacter litoralis]EAQ99381.1 Uracil-DNA glycosylase [Congregibacter litoralis KT71]